MKSEDILKKTSDLLGAKSAEKEAMKTQLENERRLLITSLAQDISSIIQPTLENMIQANQVTIDSLKQAMREIKVDVPKTEVRMPTINVPRPQVNVTVPEMKAPTVNVPAPQVNFPNKMSVSMDAVNNKAPLPVMMMDSFGKPMSFSMGAGGGGKADFFTIKDIKTSLGASLINDEGNLKIAGSFSVTASNSSTQAIDSSGEPYSQANPMPVVFSASGTTASNIIDSSGVAYSGSNPLPVTITSGGTATSASNIVDSSGVAYSGSNPVPVTGTVVVSSITATTAVANIDSSGVQYSGQNPFPMRIVTDATATVNVVNVDSAGAYRSTFPVSGTVVVSSITASSAVNLSDSSGIGYSGSNPVPVTMVTGVSSSVNVSMIDSTGIGYSGSNPVPITIVSGFINSTVTVGPVVEDAVDDGSAPVQIGGTARNANPTAVANGDVTKASFDLVGRQLMRNTQVRNLLQTAYVTEDEIQEVTLLAGATGVYHDLVYVMCANESSGAINLDFRQTTGGTVQMSVEVPATGTAGVSLPSPIPQDHADATWTVKNSASDNSNTVYSVTALFSKEV